MIIIEVTGKDAIERALKKFKRKFDNTKVLRELRNRQSYTKKSVQRRDEVKKAIYLEKKKRQEEEF
jgi:small subunit ribosomal protein S21